VDFRKFSETTELRDTPENRALLRKQAAIIGAEIQAGTFDYFRWFPSRKHNGPSEWRVTSAEPKSAKRITIAEYYHAWIERKLPPLVRPSRARDYRNHFRTYILTSMADVELAAFSLEHLEDLKLRLQAKHRLGLKTIRNVIDGSLRAMFRDARKAGVGATFPFRDLDWPGRIVLDLIRSRRRSAIVYLSISCANAGALVVIKGATRRSLTSGIMLFSSLFFTRACARPKQ
jgi:hypothetical protein